MRAHLRTVALLLVVAFVATACIGSFSAFNRLLKWNQGVSNQKWVNEALFLALNIIPVYGLALLADAIIFNSIEFWTGDNPMAKAKFSSLGDRSFFQTFALDAAGMSTRVAFQRGGSPEGTLVVSQASPSSSIVVRLEGAGGLAGEWTVATSGADTLVTGGLAGQAPSTVRYTAADLEKVDARLAAILAPAAVAAR